jgi:hypothetical protein
MSVFVYSVCVVLCVGRVHATGRSPVQGVDTRMKLKKRPGPTKKDCRAADKEIGPSGVMTYSRSCILITLFSLLYTYINWGCHNAYLIIKRCAVFAFRSKGKHDRCLLKHHARNDV